MDILFASRTEPIQGPFGSVLKFDLTYWYEKLDNLMNFQIAYKFLVLCFDPATTSAYLCDKTRGSGI
mgnify:CR=1 FL=1